MRKYIKAIFLISACIGLLWVNSASAQVFRSNSQKRQYRNQNHRTSLFEGRKLIFANVKEYITFGVSMNALNYFGDIVPKSGIGSTDITFTRPGIGFSSSVRIGSSLAVRAELLYGQMASSDYRVADPTDELAIYRYARNLHFRNNIQDLSLVGVYDFFANPHSLLFRADFTPYVFGGISVFHHNPKAKVPEEAVLYSNSTVTLPEAGKWVALQPLHTEGPDHSYSRFQISIPFGMGARYRVNQFMDIEAEVSYRYLFTDYLDDVSGNYVDKGILESDLAKVMSDRSLEQHDVLSGENRFDALRKSELINTNNVTTYTGADGQEYVILPGYGQASQLRGGAKDKDIFMTTSIRAVIIIGKSPFAKNRIKSKK